MAVRLDRRRLAVLAACAAYAAAIAFMTRAAWRERDWGFDVVCHSGAALSRSIEDPVELHRAVFDEVERALPAGAFRSVTSDSAYRSATNVLPCYPCGPARGKRHAHSITPVPIGRPPVRARS